VAVQVRKVQRDGVLRVLVVLQRVLAIVTPATHMAADEAHPDVLGLAAFLCA
jgi:hypothetical protein